MEIFCLEKNIKNANSLAKIAGVYWSARDMDKFFIGNHHFITFVYKNEEEAREITEKWGIEYFADSNEPGLRIFFSTMGAGKGKGTSIRIKFNPTSDKKAINEICKESNTEYFSPDKDFQGHKVPFDTSLKDFSSNKEFMEAILECISNFNTHYDGGDCVAYAIHEENCACIVNSIFRNLRISKNDRKLLGEFEGVDWGEEDLIPSYYFENPYYIGNNNTKELHEPHCEWIKWMDKEHKVHFSTLKEALKQGYNGCRFCLRKYDNG